MRASRASLLVSLGLIPRALSRIARSLPREISAALAWPSVVPLTISVLPELALRVRAVDDHELAVEHLAAAVLAALEQPALAGSAGADRELHRRNGVGRYEFGTPLLGGIGVVKSHD